MTTLDVARKEYQIIYYRDYSPADVFSRWRWKVVDVKPDPTQITYAYMTDSYDGYMHRGVSPVKLFSRINANFRLHKSLKKSKKRNKRNTVKIVTKKRRY